MDSNLLQQGWRARKLSFDHSLRSSVVDCKSAYIGHVHLQPPSAHGVWNDALKSGSIAAILAKMACVMSSVNADEEMPESQVFTNLLTYDWVSQRGVGQMKQQSCEGGRHRHLAACLPQAGLFV